MSSVLLWCMDILWLTFAINGVIISHTQYITMLSFEKVIYYAVHYIKYDKFLNDVFCCQLITLQV